MKWWKWWPLRRKSLKDEEMGAYSWAAGMLLSGRSTPKQIMRSVEILAEKSYGHDIRIRARADGMCEAVGHYCKLINERNP